ILISTVANFNFTTPWMAMLAATAVTLIVAIIAGLFPALKAAKLDPVESLRYE
ncbi:MAG TPA: ABC transporter permease, partial [Leeuwenhoekiella sp.]|nr:ABC transporter permease [Leeuwenhoekiella sp.]